MEVESLLLSIGVDPQKAEAGLQRLSVAAQNTDKSFNTLSSKWAGIIQGLISTVIAPVAGAFAVGKVINSYMSDISSVATMTGAYSQKLEEWRIKRAMLARVTKEDIELYKKGREAIVGFRIAMADLSAKIMREAMPVMKFMIDGLNTFSKWVDRNGHNIVRFLMITAGVLTTVFLPSLLKLGAAMLANPLVWMVAALGVLIAVIDDLIVYIKGGQSAFGKFWSVFGTGKEIGNALSATFSALKDVFAVLAKPLAVLAAGFAAFKTGTVIFQGLTSAVMGLHRVFLLLAANPIGLVLFAIAGVLVWLIDAFNRAGGDWTKMCDIMKGDIVDFLNIFGGLGDTISSALSGLSGVFDGVLSTILGVFNTIMQVCRLFWAYLTGSSQKTKDEIAAALQQAFKSIIDGIFILLSGIPDAVMFICGQVLKAFGALWAAALRLPGLVLDVLSGICEFFLSALSALVGAILNMLPTGVADAVRAAARFIVNLLKPVGVFVSTLTDSVCKAWRQGCEFIKSLFSAAVGSVQNRIQSAVDFCRDVSGAIGDTFRAVTADISAFTERLAAAVIVAAQLVFQTLKSVFAPLVGFFQRAVSGVAQILSSIAETVVSVFKSAVAVISGFFESLRTDASALVQSFMSVFGSVQDLIVSVFGNAKRIVTDFFSFIWDALSAIPAKIADAFDFSKVFSGLKSSISSGIDSMKSFLFGDDDDDSKENKSQRGAKSTGALAQIDRVYNQTPVNSNTTAYTANSVNSSNTSNSSSQQSNTANIVINAHGSDPRAVSDAVIRSLSMNDYSCVTTTDGGNKSI